jgi:hypothetical protein
MALNSRFTARKGHNKLVEGASAGCYDTPDRDLAVTSSATANTSERSTAVEIAGGPIGVRQQQLR